MTDYWTEVVERWRKVLGSSLGAVEMMRMYPGDAQVKQAAIAREATIALAAAEQMAERGKKVDGSFCESNHDWRVRSHYPDLQVRLVVCSKCPALSVWPYATAPPPDEPHEPKCAACGLPIAGYNHEDICQGNVCSGTRKESHDMTMPVLVCKYLGFKDPVCVEVRKPIFNGIYWRWVTTWSLPRPQFRCVRFIR